MNKKISVRQYGDAPFRVAVIHGGPGAPGMMAPLAKELAAVRGILEPLQRASSVEGQIEKLKAQLEAYAKFPVILIGHSWGAWLSYLIAAHYPELVSKLILVSSGPFEAEYTEGMTETRLSRLSPDEQAEARTIMSELSIPSTTNKDSLMARLGALFEKADTYDPLPLETVTVECQYEVHTKVWLEAARLRKSGVLLKLGERIQSPVIGIHGDYDPHPAVGVEKPLSAILSDFRFILLQRCGHEPWAERHARDRFFKILKQEIA
ncbi:MAG: alpha/beta hydrolase [bacterium]